MLVTDVLPMSWMVLLFNLVFFCLSFPFSKMRFFLWLKSHSKASWLETNLFFIISLLTLTCDTKHPNYDAFNNLLFSSYLVLNAIIIIGCHNISFSYFIIRENCELKGRVYDELFLKNSEKEFVIDNSSYLSHYAIDFLVIPNKL